MARSVVMAAIPGEVTRGPATRTDLSYARYGRATWQWWCERNGVGFHVLDRPLDDAELAAAPPPLHRWRAAQRLLANGGQVAVVDADTMIRWDAPDFFALAGDGVAAVLEREPDWIVRSIAAYQRFFPGVALNYWEYVNSGLVVLGARHAPLLAELVSFYHRNRAELEAVQRDGDVGVDQTLLNFVVRRAGAPTTVLPQPFNLVHCLPLPWLTVMELESGAPAQRRRDLLDEILATPGIFDFVGHSYVWHFNNTVAVRTEFMRRTWEHVRAHYPGAPDPTMLSSSRRR